MDMSIAVFLTINGKIPSSNYKSLPALNDHSLHICSFFHTHGLLKNRVQDEEPARFKTLMPDDGGNGMYDHWNTSNAVLTGLSFTCNHDFDVCLCCPLR